MKLKYPINYIKIKEYYKKDIHSGIDLYLEDNHTENEKYIHAPADGIITNIRNNYDKENQNIISYGNYIKIKHDDNLYTLCAHLESNSIPYKIGDKVKQGDIIGKIGSTGTNKGPHLHYEVFINENKEDPTTYTYVYENQLVSKNENEKIGIKYNKSEIKQLENNKQIQELQDKISLQSKEIDALKKELQDKEDFTFTYKVEKTSKYEILLNEGETLYIK